MSHENDPESLTNEKPRHRSQHEVERWHHRLHPGVTKENARNAMFKPVAWVFHPTYAELISEAGGSQKWSARDHRKHRYVGKSPVSKKNRDGKGFWVKLSHMARIEYWNVSWWVAQAFTWGSVVWVVNGFASFLPFCNSHFQEAPTSVGWTAFLGATIFEFGSIFGMWEAWNRDDAASFGWSVKEAFHHDSDESVTHRRGTHDDPSSDTVEVRTASTKGQKKWIWFTTDPRYFRELGFLAAFFQLLAASIFWISGFTAIPQIQDALKPNTAALDGAFWTPQVIGGVGFVISSTFIMLEAQKVWYKPEPLSLGWHVGLWNFIGGVGFALCGALGYSSSSGAKYESSLSTFWGGWAFLIGSVIQWYESVNSVS